MPIVVQNVIKMVLSASMDSYQTVGRLLLPKPKQYAASASPYLNFHCYDISTHSTDIILTFSTDFIVPHHHHAVTILTVSTVFDTALPGWSGPYMLGTKHIFFSISMSISTADDVTLDNSKPTHCIAYIPLTYTAIFLQPAIFGNQPEGSGL